MSIYKHKARRTWHIVAVLVLLGASLFLPLMSQDSVEAAGNYNNASIADQGLARVGQHGGECWQFVRNMIYIASGQTQDISAQSGNYFQHLAGAGGTRITDMNKLAKGDVVQIGPNGGHTFIIVKRVSGSTFNVVDSNHQYDGIIRNYNRSVGLSDSTRAYRFGKVSGSSGWSVGGATYRGTQLAAGQTLHRGQYLASGNLQYALVLQSDGNLVLYRAGKALWNTHTGGSGANRLVMQGDGNLVLYAGSTPRWHSRTGGSGANRAVVQADGNFVVYAGSSAKWQSRTGGHSTYLYSRSDKLTKGQQMGRNRYIRSADGRYALLLQADGNLVLYSAGYHVIWHSKTGGSGADKLVMQGDGNLVLYAGGTARWHTHTGGSGAGRAVMQSDGNFVVYAGSTPRWHTHTGGKI